MIFFFEVYKKSNTYMQPSKKRTIDKVESANNSSSSAAGGGISDVLQRADIDKRMLEKRTAFIK